jgi:hypothetical protein
VGQIGVRNAYDAGRAQSREIEPGGETSESAGDVRSISVNLMDDWFFLTYHGFLTITFSSRIISRDCMYMYVCSRCIVLYFFLNFQRGVRVLYREVVY